MPILKAAALASLFLISDVNAFAPTRPVVPSVNKVASVSSSGAATTNAFKDFRTSSLFMVSASAQTATCLYNVLGVSRHADMKEIRQAFRMMAKRYHPDSNPNENTIEQFQQVNRAYEVLRNEALRKNYDMYGFDGIGTSASSDEEELEYYSKQQQHNTGFGNFGQYGAQCDQNIRSRYYEEMKVDEACNSYDEDRAKYWGENVYARPSGSEATCDQSQPRQSGPMRGSCFVDVGNIGMGATSDTFFGKQQASGSAAQPHVQPPNNANARPRGPTAPVPSDQTAPKEPFRGGCFMDVQNNIGMGPTTDTFFGDAEKKNTAKPNGPRPAANRKTTHSATSRGVPSDNFFGKSRGSMQTGIFEVTDTTNSNNSFFGKVVDGKPPGARNVRAPRNNRQQADIQPPPFAANANPSPFVGKSDPFGRTAAPKSRQAPKSPFAGGNKNNRVKKEVNVGNVNIGGATNNARSAAPRGGRVPSIGGDIQMELDIDFTTAYYGGEARVIVTRLEQANADGTSLKRKASEIKVNIPAGSKDGSMVRLTGEGDAGVNGGPSGDLFVFLRAQQQEPVRPAAEVPKAPQQETMKVEIPKDLNEEELALFNKLQGLLEQRGKQP